LPAGGRAIGQNDRRVRSWWAGAAGRQAVGGRATSRASSSKAASSHRTPYKAASSRRTPNKVAWGCRTANAAGLLDPLREEAAGGFGVGDALNTERESGEAAAEFEFPFLVFDGLLRAIEDGG